MTQITDFIKSISGIYLQEGVPSFLTPTAASAPKTLNTGVTIQLGVPSQSSVAFVTPVPVTNISASAVVAQPSQAAKPLTENSKINNVAKENASATEGGSGSTFPVMDGSLEDKSAIEDGSAIGTTSPGKKTAIEDGSSIGTTYPGKKSAIEDDSSIGTIPIEDGSSIGTIPIEDGSSIGTIPIEDGSAIGTIPIEDGSAIGTTSPGKNFPPIQDTIPVDSSTKDISVEITAPVSSANTCSALEQTGVEPSDSSEDSCQQVSPDVETSTENTSEETCQMSEVPEKESAEALAVNSDIVSADEEVNASLGDENVSTVAPSSGNLDKTGVLIETIDNSVAIESSTSLNGNTINKCEEEFPNSEEVRLEENIVRSSDSSQNSCSVVVPAEGSAVESITCFSEANDPSAAEEAVSSVSIDETPKIKDEQSSTKRASKRKRKKNAPGDNADTLPKRPRSSRILRSNSAKEEQFPPVSLGCDTPMEVDSSPPAVTVGEEKNPTNGRTDSPNSCAPPDDEENDNVDKINGDKKDSVLCTGTKTGVNVVGDHIAGETLEEMKER